MGCAPGQLSRSSLASQVQAGAHVEPEPALVGVGPEHRPNRPTLAVADQIVETGILQSASKHLKPTYESRALHR